MKFEEFLIGKYVNLVLLDEKVVKNTDWYSWLNYYENTKILEVGKFPNTLKKQLDYVKNELASKKQILSFEEVDKKIQLGVVDRTKNILVGMVSAYGINYISKTCNVSVITDLRKKNINRLQIFKECQDMLLDHLFFTLNLRKIYTGATDKKLSDMTMKIWGFKREAIYKKHAYIDGKYMDGFVLGLFKEDWEKLRKKKS
jgi:diamine N-acetyltransferase